MSQLPTSWVIGVGGLLGSHVERALTKCSRVWRPDKRIPWGTTAAVSQLRLATTQFAAAVADSPWQVAWCAGSGVTSTSAAALTLETTAFDAILGALSDQLPPDSDGAAFLASSAGGIYAGSRDAPPFTEHTSVQPISPYGQAKLNLERRISDWAAVHGWPVLIGRISNLYGPGQNLAKPQGLVSQLCRAHLLRQPISIYVPLDTVRDYLYAADCGAVVADALIRLRSEAATGGPPVTTKVIASQRSVPIGCVLSQLEHMVKRRIPVINGVTSGVQRFQARDLRFRSVVWSEIDRRRLTPFPAGLHATLDDMIRRIQVGSVRR